jgi:hypothetical protein
MLRKRWADETDLKRCILRSRRHTTWCEFWARLFLRSSYSRQLDVGEGGAVGAQLIGYHHLWREALFFSAACESASELRAGLACIEPAHRGSPPSWLTARHRYIHLPAIRTTISSRCQRSLGRERHRRTRRAIIGSEFHHPAANRLVRNVEPSLGKESQRR